MKDRVSLSFSLCLPEKCLGEVFHGIGDVVSTGQWIDATGDTVVEIIQGSNFRGN